MQHEFYWKSMCFTTADYVAFYSNFQCNNAEHLKPAGLLQPLELPTQVWVDITIDFIDGISKSWGKKIPFMVMNRFSEYAHPLSIAYPYTTSRVAWVFLNKQYDYTGCQNQ